MLSENYETLLSLLINQATKSAPVRLTKAEAMRYVNRSRGKFEAWCERHAIKPRLREEGGRVEEYYVFDLATAILADYHNPKLVKKESPAQ